jgi:pectinesterase
MIRSSIGFATAAGAFILASTLKASADSSPGMSASVASDGSGQYTSVQEAINAAPQTSTAATPWTIRIKPGTYHERVYVQREKHYVRLVGEDPDRTTIAFEFYAAMTGLDGKPVGTFHTPTVWIDADDFSVENLTISNTAGNRGYSHGQALALRVDGDRVVFRNCRFLGWQDTILVNRGRQYFTDCTVAGAVDFIFGGATAYFEKCQIQIMGTGYITAPSTPAEQPYGLVFSDCRITGGGPGIQTYLGRPWRPYGSTIFVNTQMSEVVRPVGWHNWGKPEREKTARFEEFGSNGAGANPRARVPWATTSSVPAKQDLSAAHVLCGADHWGPETAIPPFGGSAEPVQR